MKNEKERKARIKNILKELDEARKEYRGLKEEYNALPDNVKMQEDLEEFKEFEAKIDEDIKEAKKIVNYEERSNVLGYIGNIVRRDIKRAEDLLTRKQSRKETTDPNKISEPETPAPGISAGEGKGISDEKRQKIRTQRQELREGNEEAKETAPSMLARLFDSGRALKKEASDYDVKVKKWKEIKNNCVEYIFEYKNTGEFAGKIVLYKPYFQYFDYSLKNFVGEKGKRFLEEMTNIRDKNQQFAGETSLPMIKEWQDSKKRIHSQSIPTRLTINPITGGYRRLTFMYSVNINGERFWPNVKFPGDIPIKKRLHLADFYTTIFLMEKYNEKMFPSIMCVELPKGKYNFYNTPRIYDKYTDENPRLIFFFTPEGRRMVDFSVQESQRERYIEREYIDKITSKTGLSFEMIIERIAKDPFRFLAHCHMNEIYLSMWGTDAHYGNFFLSEKGEVYNVSDIGRKRHTSNIRVKIKEDIKFLVRYESLRTILRHLKISEEDIKEKYIPMALNTYLETLEKEGAKKLRSLFSDKEALLGFSKDELDILRQEKKEVKQETKKEIFGFLKQNIEQLNLDENEKHQWLEYYGGKIKETDKKWSLYVIKDKIIDRFQNNEFKEEDLKKVLPEMEERNKMQKIKKEIYASSKQKLEQLNLDENEKHQWLSHYKDKLKEAKNREDIDKIEEEMKKRFETRKILKQDLEETISKWKSGKRKGELEEEFGEEEPTPTEPIPGPTPIAGKKPRFEVTIVTDTGRVDINEEAQYNIKIKERSGIDQNIGLKCWSENPIDELKLEREKITVPAHKAVIVTLTAKNSAELKTYVFVKGINEHGFEDQSDAVLEVYKRERPTKEPEPSPSIGLIDTHLVCKDQKAMENTDYAWFVDLYDKEYNKLDGKEIVFSKEGISIGSNTTKNGRAFVSVRTGSSGEKYRIKVYFGGDDKYNPSHCEAELTVRGKMQPTQKPTPTGPKPIPTTGKKPTKITCYDKTTQINVPIELGAYLCDKNDAPLEGKTIKFSVAGKSVDPPVQTDLNGEASISVAPPAAGSFKIKADFAGDIEFDASSGIAVLTVTEESVPSGPTPTGPTPAPATPETKIKKYNADIIVKPYNIPQGQKTNISIELKKIYPMDKSGLKYELQKNEIYYLLIRGNKDIYSIDANGATVDVGKKILCHIRRGLLETIIKPSEDAVIGSRSFIVFSKKKSGERSALIYPRKNCFKVVEAKKEGIISHEVHVIAEAIHAIGTPHEKKHEEKKIEFAVFPNRIYKSAEDKQKEIILIELFNVPEKLRDKIYIKEMAFDDYKDKSHIQLVDTTVEKRGDAIFQAILSIDFETKIGHPLTELVLGIKDNDEKEIRISKKDAIEIFNPEAIAKEKEVPRGEEMWVELELKGMKIDKNKKYDFIFKPSSKIDIKNHNQDESAEIGIKVLDAELLGTKRIKLMIFVPEDELLGSYDLEIAEVVDEYKEKKGFRNLMDRIDDASRSA